jgi:hypothetical protein
MYTVLHVSAVQQVIRADAARAFPCIAMPRPMNPRRRNLLNVRPFILRAAARTAHLPKYRAYVHIRWSACFDFFMMNA